MERPFVPSETAKRQPSDKSKRQSSKITMPCYICLEEDQGKLLNVRGCFCKGGIEVHKACLQEWISKADNPFNCSVCKGHYSGSFLKKFLSEEEILYRSNGEDEEDEEDDIDSMDSFVYLYNGISIMNTYGTLCFESEKDMTIYIEMTNKEDKSIKLELRSRQKKFSRIQLKQNRHQPKWSKRVPFRK